MSCGIYKITNKTNNKIYIGQSLNIERRWRDHINYAKNKGSREYNTAIHNAIRKYGSDNFILKILEICDEANLNKKEIFYIKSLHSNDRDIGYNLTIGGLGGHKINCKPVLQYDLGGNFIKRWSSIWQVANFYNIPDANIRCCCCNQTKSAHGFQWKYENDSKEISKYINNRNLSGLELGRKKVKIEGYNEDLLISFNSITEAAVWLVENQYSKAKNINSICSRISSIKNTDAYGYKFKWRCSQ